MDEHLKRLKVCGRHLVEFVLPDITFINELLSADVITSRHKQHIEVGNTSADRNTRILEILEKRSIADLKNYVKCLVKTHQGHLAPLLIQNTGIYTIYR
jgi:hypothetical protein